VEYEAFGNTTKLPAADAGGNELTSTYYVDSQVASQKQNGETVSYTYDPSGRTMETVSEGKTASKVISHYAGPGEALTWTSEGAEKWTRNIPGIGGALDAIETSGGSTTLQLHDLEGNIVGEAALSETETKLLKSYNSTEFGVPQPGTTPPRYAWLGAGGVATEPSFASGISTQGGASYVPEIGRPLQTGPIASPGSFPDGTSGVGIVQAAYLQSAAGQIKGIAVEHEAELEEAKKKEAEQDAPLGCIDTCAQNDGPGEGNFLEGLGGGGEEPEWEGTVGDPVPCNIHAYEPTQEEGEVTGHKLEGWGSFECANEVANITFEVCLQVWVHEKWINGRCNPVTYRDASSGESSVTIGCKVGLSYRTWVWLGVGHESGLAKHGATAECEENLAEEGLGLI
jgi:YD repeat-containing protein